MAGKIIVIEGTDSSGKETQTKMLVEKLLQRGVPCIYFSFPMYGSPTGDIVGGPYLGKKEICSSYFKEGSVNVDPYVVCLYYAADRKYHLPKIMEYLNKDYYVILDRYTTSNLAHQGSKILDKDERFHMYQWIDKLEYWLLQLPKPDKTIFLHMPFEYTKELKKNRENTDEHEENDDYLKNSIDAYIELSELYNWDRVECVSDGKIRSVEEINKDILKFVDEI